MTRPDDEFYVGYQERAPGGLAGWLRVRVIAVALLGAVVAALLASAQRSFDPSSYEWGEVREFTGWVEERPYPALVVERPAAGGDAERSRYLLVAVGKKGAAAEVEGLDRQAVTLRGTLIYREDQTMIEVDAGSVVADPARPPLAPAAASRVALGSQTLAGEIVDSKCFLGVMKPAQRKPHRACATRCISGGIPPVLLVRDAEGRASYFLLTGADGETVNREVLPFVAEPVEITGQVLRQDNLLILRADPATIRRLG